MSVAAIPARDWALTAEPSIGAIAVGIAFHQWADFSWALVFFGVLGKMDRQAASRLACRCCGAVGHPDLGARMVRSGALVSFWQPIFTLQQPYWIGFLVHLSSASMYPLFAWLRRSPSERRRIRRQNIPPSLEFGRNWRNPAAWDCRAVRRLRSRTAVGRSGSDQSTRPSSGTCRPIMSREFCWLQLPPRGLATRIFAPSRSSWWRARGERPGFSRIGGQAGSMNRCRSVRRRNAPRCPACSMRRTSRNSGRQKPPSFDRLFVELMTRHHKGAVAMADLQLRDGSDPRLRIMAHAIRHEQQGEIALMHGLDGAPAVSGSKSGLNSVQNLLFGT